MPEKHFTGPFVFGLGFITASFMFGIIAGSVRPVGDVLTVRVGVDVSISVCSCSDCEMVIGHRSGS